MSRSVFPSETGLSIALLGRFTVYVDGIAVSDNPWGRVHLRRLVELTGSHRTRREARDVVLEALWPGFDEARARNRLHHTVHLLRKAAESCGAGSSVIRVDAQGVELGAEIATDVDVIQRLIAMQASPPERLRALVSACDLYKGDLAPEWIDCDVIEARRVKLYRSHLEALADAADLALDLGQIETALSLLRRLTTADPADADAHVQYAEALFRSGRADLALAHCVEAQQRVREDLGEAAAAPLFEAARRIQREANTTNIAADVRSDNRDGALRSRPTLASGSRRLFGRASLLDQVRTALQDPHASVVSLCGPPGVGKTAIGWASASSAQEGFRDGAVLVDCCDVRSSDSLLETLSAAVRPFMADSKASPEQVLHFLTRCQMLLWLDGLQASNDCSAMLGRLASSLRDCRFLVGSVRRLNVTGERCIRVGTLAFEDAPNAGAADVAPALQMLESCCRVQVPELALNDRTRVALRRVARLMDGLPAALEVAAAWLQMQTPSELIARLERLIEGEAIETTMHVERTLNIVLDRWLFSAGNALHAMLAQASAFHGWFTREDLRVVLGAPVTSSEVDGLLQDALDASLLFRRVGLRNGSAISEFRLPYLVHARVKRASDLRIIKAAEGRHCAHILAVVERVHVGIDEEAEYGMGELLQCYLADIEAVVAVLADKGPAQSLVKLVLAVLPELVQQGHLDKALRWLSLALQHSGTDHGTRIELLLARASVLDKMNRTEVAFREAESAYRLACEHSDTKRQPAIQRLVAMLARRSGNPLDVDAGTVTRPVSRVAVKGIEAGENLLRVAVLAARHGSLRQALDSADSAERVFRQFSCVPGQLRALRYVGRLAFAIGDLDRAGAACDKGLAIAARHSQEEEQFRVHLLMAEAQLAQVDTHEQVRKVEHLLGRAQHSDMASLVARATRVLAWHHFEAGNLALARILGTEYKKQALALDAPSLRANAHLLMAALHARLGGRTLALKELAALTPLVRESRLPTDPQTDLATLGLLALDLQQNVIAAGAASALDSFEQSPGHCLRPSVQRHHLEIRSRLATSGDRIDVRPGIQGTARAFEALLLQAA